MYATRRASTTAFFRNTRGARGMQTKPSESRVFFNRMIDTKDVWPLVIITSFGVVLLGNFVYHAVARTRWDKTDRRNMKYFRWVCDGSRARNDTDTDDEKPSSQYVAPEKTATDQHVVKGEGDPKSFESETTPQGKKEWIMERAVF